MTRKKSVRLPGSICTSAPTTSIARAYCSAVADAIIVDMHAEATSEKMAMGHLCDGRATLVVGTHTHVPTADAQILPGGTAYQTDAGACADYDSVIGNHKEEPIRRFTTKGVYDLGKKTHPLPGDSAAAPVAPPAPSEASVSLTYSQFQASANTLDYSAFTGSMTFAPGETVKVVRVPISPDTDLEGFETFGLQIANVTGPLGSRQIAVGELAGKDVVIGDFDRSDGQGLVHRGPRVPRVQLP